MKIGIIYESKTGNTKLVAEALNESFEGDNTVIYKSIEEVLKDGIEDDDIDVYFLGSWTDKGNCGDSMKEFSKSLNGQKIALFGTAGFGGSEEYYKSLADRFSKELPESNEIIGHFYCQGEMPIGIRNRYVEMLTKHPEDEKLEVSIENFDAAQSHPDKDDLRNAKMFGEKVLERIIRK